MTAIVGAFDEEIKVIEERMTEKQVQQYLGIKFTTGKLNAAPVVLTLTGVGKVNAAMITTLLLSHYRPREVIFTGIAGALNPSLRPGDIVIGEKVAQHDVGLLTEDGFKAGSVGNPLNGKENPVFFLSDPRLVALALQASEKAELKSTGKEENQERPKVVKGTIVTGDLFVASKKKKAELRDRFEADAVEMEGGAIAQVCFQHGVPFIVLRSMSDRADQNARVEIKEFYRIAARNSAELVSQLAAMLADGPG